MASATTRRLKNSISTSTTLIRRATMMTSQSPPASIYYSPSGGYSYSRFVKTTTTPSASFSRIFSSNGSEIIMDANCTNCSNETNATETESAHRSGLPCDWYGWDILDIVLFFLGTIGNVMALVMMRRRGLRSRSYALSLSVLALFNSLTLFVLSIQAADRLSQKFYRGSLEAHIGTIGCKFYRIALPIVQLMSHWVVVFITTERFVAICFPMAVTSIFSATTSKITLSSLFGIVVLSQIWRPFFDIQERAVFGNFSNGTRFEMSPAQCFSEHFQVFQNIDLFYHQLFMLCLLPAVIIFVMNTAVIVQVYRMGREIRKSGGYHRGGQANNSSNASHTHTAASRLPSMAASSNSTQNHSAVTKMDSSRRSSLKPRATPQNSSSDDSSGRNRKTTILLLTVSCSFFVYITPLLFLMLYVRIIHLIEGPIAALFAFSGLCVPMKAASLLTNLSYADNFIIFVLAGEKFRKELHLMILKGLATCCPRLFEEKYLAEQSRVSTRRTVFLESTSSYAHGSRSRALESQPSTNSRTRRHSDYVSNNKAKDADHLLAVNKHNNNSNFIGIEEDVSAGGSAYENATCGNGKVVDEEADRLKSESCSDSKEEEASLRLLGNDCLKNGNGDITINQS